jgi:AcrR family transcriptional regulator
VILRSLETLLADHPIHEIEVDDIARVSGLTRSGFYFYFPTRSAALASLAESTFEAMIDVGAAWYERDDLDHLSRVRQGLSETAAYWRQHATLLRALSLEAGSEGESKALWEGMQQQFYERAAARIEADRKAGLVATDVDAASLAVVLVGATVEAMRRDLHSLVTTGQPTSGLVEALVRLWDASLYR